MDAKECIQDIQANSLLQDIQVNLLDIQDNLLDIQVNSLDIQVNTVIQWEVFTNHHQVDICHHQEATIFQEQWMELEHQTLLKLLVHQLKMQIRKRIERFDLLLNFFKYIQQE